MSPKAHYQRLRTRSCEQLWCEDVVAFDRADARERMQTVAVVRAVGVVFAESGSSEQREQAREWLLSLLHDPEEKVRRYAMAALPKIGAHVREESKLLDLLDETSSERERISLGRALEKIGGAATLAKAPSRLPDRVVQKVAGNLARAAPSGGVRFDVAIPLDPSLRVHLRGRRGLETLVKREIDEQPAETARFAIRRIEPGLAVIAPFANFTFADLYTLRCFATASFLLGTARRGSETEELDALASVIASPLARRLFRALTDGPIRYRLDFVSRGHRRSLVRQLGDRIYALCPELINDSREAPWQMDIHETSAGYSVELSPRLRPDPRFAYRLADVPAASHPPLAAGMARLAGAFTDEVVWDPFCGSGSELIECALRGNVRRIVGTDRSAEAIEIARANFAAAIPQAPATSFLVADFREDVNLRPGEASLIITNPPLGRRVPIPNLGGLIADLFVVAESSLCPNGRLVFVNPLATEPISRSLQLEFRQEIDLGGFTGRLEKYVKIPCA